MPRVEKQVVVDVPVRTAYNQWTQFETFPEFMSHVTSVEQLDERRLRWQSTIGGRQQEWTAEIREQVPDEKVIWHSTDGSENAGIVQFEALEENRTRVTLQLSYDPSGLLENVGDALGMLDRDIEIDLANFKHFIESQSSATGAYRGALANPDAPGGHTSGEPGASHSSD